MNMSQTSCAREVVTNVVCRRSGTLAQGKHFCPYPSSQSSFFTWSEVNIRLLFFFFLKQSYAFKPIQTERLMKGYKQILTIHLDKIFSLPPNLPRGWGRIKCNKMLWMRWLCSAQLDLFLVAFRLVRGKAKRCTYCSVFKLYSNNRSECLPHCHASKDKIILCSLIPANSVLLWPGKQQFSFL